MQNIKKRYLLDNSIKSLIKDLNLKSDTISYFFATDDLDQEIKYTKIDNSFYKKFDNQDQMQISQKEFKKAKENKVSKIVKKQRYYLLLDGKKYIIDRYKKRLKKINILELEFSDQKEYEKFIMPDFLQDFIIQEVTKENKFKDEKLALLTNLKTKQKTKYNIYEIFKKFQRNEIDSLDQIITKDMQDIDAIRIVLYKLFLSLKEDSNKLIASNQNKVLYSFRFNIAKIETILTTFKSILDTQTVNKLISNLSNTLNATDKLKDLESLKNNLNDLRNYFDEEKLSKLDSFIIQLKESLKEEKFKIRTLLTSREIQIIFRQLEIFIKEDTQTKKVSPNSIHDTALKVLNQKLKELKESENEIDKIENISTKNLQKFLLTFSKFYYLFSEFIYILDIKDLKNLKDSIQELKSKIELFFELEKKRLIYTSYIDNLNSTDLLYERIEAELNFEISKQQDTLLHDIKNLLSTISKIDFKI